MGNKNTSSFKNEIAWSNIRLQVGIPTHNTWKTSCYLSTVTLSAAQKPHGYVIPQSDDDLQICPTPSHHILLRGLEYLVVQKSQKQTAANSEILPHFYNKGLQNSFTQGSISNCRDNAHRTSYAPI